ncbi:hypothetical protein Goari_008462 [Gossypium aridum]|uniref:Uncharacterized protein n=1 Tax=Gossypium aridum TaxID=34290 RepID=A0A7J8XVF5_GOSAI|nr:hypothetical protein [Gossypium aridum]
MKRRKRLGRVVRKFESIEERFAGPVPGSEYSSVELQRMLMTDSGMAAAAQQLMQLSDEDNSSISSSNGNQPRSGGIVSLRVFTRRQNLGRLATGIIYGIGQNACAIGVKEVEEQGSCDEEEPLIQIAEYRICQEDC